jgi:hypothetical protein
MNAAQLGGDPCSVYVLAAPNSIEARLLRNTPHAFGVCQRRFGLSVQFGR